MKDVVIVSAKRTPIGAFGKSLSSFTAPELGAAVVVELVKDSGLQPDQIQELIFGHVLTAGTGQAPARQVALKAGLHQRTPATAVNKVCSSGMKSIMAAANQIRLGEADIMVAGGTESMSNTPYYLRKHRFGSKLGHQKVEDGILVDGLWDVYNDFHMGSAAELCARECNFSREEQDEYAKRSYERALKADEEGWFEDEIVPMKVKDRKGNVTKVTRDEGPHLVNFDKMSRLSPAFEKEGTVTAANASSINDGAAGVILMSAEEAEKRDMQPLARITSQASAAQAPEWFTTAPSAAIPIALERAGWEKSDVDLWEINEAFAVVSLANNQKLDLDPDYVNIHGGAVSLGHPIGCSGARIVVTLLHALRQNNYRRGCAGICNGGGGASAMTLEMV